MTRPIFTTDLDGSLVDLLGGCPDCEGLSGARAVGQDVWAYCADHLLTWPTGLQREPPSAAPCVEEVRDAVRFFSRYGVVWTDVPPADESSPPNHPSLAEGTA